MRKVRLLLWEKIQRKFYFISGDNSAWRKVLGINPAFPQEKIAELCEFYQIDFFFMIKIY